MRTFCGVWVRSFASTWPKWKVIPRFKGPKSAQNGRYTNDLCTFIILVHTPSSKYCERSTSLWSARKSLSSSTGMRSRTAFSPATASLNSSADLVQVRTLPPFLTVSKLPFSFLPVSLPSFVSVSKLTVFRGATPSRELGVRPSPTAVFPFSASTCVCSLSISDCRRTALCLFPGTVKHVF